MQHPVMPSPEHPSMLATSQVHTVLQIESEMSVCCVSVDRCEWSPEDSTGRGYGMCVIFTA